MSIVYFNDTAVTDRAKGDLAVDAAGSYLAAVGVSAPANTGKLYFRVNCDLTPTVPAAMNFVATINDPLYFNFIVPPADAGDPPFILAADQVRFNNMSMHHLVNGFLPFQLVNLQGVAVFSLAAITLTVNEATDPAANMDVANPNIQTY